jgi:hypothetical protein
MRGRGIWILGFLSSIASGADRYDQASAASLRAVAPPVVVAECSAILERAGLSCAALETDTRRQLEAAGLPPRSPSLPADPKEPPPMLAIRVSSARMAPNHAMQYYAITIRLDLFQSARIPRLGAESFPVSTWYTQHTVLMGRSRLKDIPQDTASAVDEFIQAWKTGNMTAK